MELPSPGLHSDNGTEGSTVSQELLDSVIWNRLSLNNQLVQQVTLSLRYSFWTSVTLFSPEGPL